MKIGHKYYYKLTYKIFFESIKLQTLTYSSAKTRLYESNATNAVSA